MTAVQRWQRAVLKRDPRNLGREGLQFWVEEGPPRPEVVIVEREDGMPCDLDDEDATVRLEQEQYTTNLRYPDSPCPVVVPAWAVELLPEFADTVPEQELPRPEPVTKVR